MFKPYRLAVLLAALCAGMAAGAPAAGPATPREPIRPLPLSSGADPARAAVGRELFHDLRLSRDNTHSCASCHRLGQGGADGRALASGAGGVASRFNTPTVFNSALNLHQSWSGAYRGIDGVLEHVMTSPQGGAGNWQVLASRLTGDPVIAARFQRVYGKEVGPELLKDALDNYLRSLQTPSRFDRYLRGDQRAISADEKLGYAAFKRFGCASCHQGVNVGGNMFQKFGAMRPLAPGAPIGLDPGRYAHTGREADRHMLRVPSLRNVALTAPYFHNGSVATLDEAVEAMLKYQLGRTATRRERDFIVRFLHTLSGETMPPAGAQP